MRHRQKGLTLVELLVTLAVAVILVTVGMPLFTGSVANNRAATQVNGLLSAILLARGEAIKRGEPVTICPVLDATASPPVCGGASDWPNGWTVYFDDGGSVDEHLRVWQSMQGNATVTTTSTGIQFDSKGTANSATDFVLQLAGTTGTTNRCIAVTVAGQARSWRSDPPNNPCP